MSTPGLGGPRLGPVTLVGQTLSGHLDFVQLVDSTVEFLGRTFVAGVDEWTGGILFADHLGISFAERLADVPEFVAGVQHLTGRVVSSVRGEASLALPVDPPLLGDWIRTGVFDPDRLTVRFDRRLGGRWVARTMPKYPRDPDSVIIVHIDRTPGT